MENEPTPTHILTKDQETINVTLNTAGDGFNEPSVQGGILDMKNNIYTLNGEVWVVAPYVKVGGRRRSQKKGGRKSKKCTWGGKKSKKQQKGGKRRSQKQQKGYGGKKQKKQQQKQDPVM